METNQESKKCCCEASAELLTRIEETILRYSGGSPMIGGQALCRTLNYGTMAAFRKAELRGVLPIPAFRIESRPGVFALVHDVATWMVAQREKTILAQNASGIHPATTRKEKSQ